MVPSCGTSYYIDKYKIFRLPRSAARLMFWLGDRMVTLGYLLPVLVTLQLRLIELPALRRRCRSGLGPRSYLNVEL
jgi:hypothetical protein